MPNTAKTTGRKPAIKADVAVLEAVGIAKAAAESIAKRNSVGEHIGAAMAADRLALHRFECRDEGYVGWHWEVSLTRAPRSKQVTVCEVDLLPGPDSLLAPPWVPWEERLEPGDLSRTDVLPYNANDPRLVSGFEQTDQDGADARQIEELGLGRARVLGPAGISDAATRWYASARGPVPGLRPQSTCSTCGFLVKISGGLGQLFGICANEWAPDDATVVSMDHGCGAHSETDTVRRHPQWPIAPSRVDDFDVEMLTSH